LQRAFVIRPFGTKKDSAGNQINFERVHDELIAPALKDAGVAGGTTGEIIESGSIREDMFSLIIEADLVVCDITVHNANVFYELGIRHALRKKGSVLIKGSPFADATPFDILTDRYLSYQMDELAKARDELADTIQATLNSPRETDSPIFKMLPVLKEVDAAIVQAIPMDLGEEVDRAVAAKSRGWLRLLASEVVDRRFQWPALRLIGQAQRQIKDYDSAEETLKRVIENDPNDIVANLALADIYERRYRRQKNPDLIERSHQAIARILRSGRATALQRAEALAQEGRNRKTLWRLEFERLDDVVRRREVATNRALCNAFEAYRDAFLVDLNHYWSGLAALQIGTVALDLSRDPAWEDAFDDAAQAEAYKIDLARQAEALRATVSLAMKGALKRLERGDKDRVWAEISAADLAFLVEENPRRAVKAYLNAVPQNDFFAWDSARGQLELFSNLGVKAELANEVIKAVDDRMREPEPVADLHAVIVVGHQIDEAARPEPRFPAKGEMRARELMLDQLQRLRDGGARVHVFASAAPGADIICHELCSELGIESTVCLPMSKDVYGRLTFGELDTWRSRYLALVDRCTLLELNSEEGLPRWLRGTQTDPWERGNRWVLELARTRGARNVTLIALWDGKPGPALGGTAHMVRIAREAGSVDVVHIDATQLLA